MKENIHPQFHTGATVTCACGNSFVTGSVEKALHTEICSACHPFYTGKQKLVDTMGRVDRFKRSITSASSIKSAIKPKKERKARAKK
jgi:large subunit ribosomal protein L31